MRSHSSVGRDPMGCSARFYSFQWMSVEDTGNIGVAVISWQENGVDIVLCNSAQPPSLNCALKRRH